MEEYALGMEQRRNDAAVKDVRTKLRKEECASGMEQRKNYTYATLKDVRTLLSEEECAGGMEQRSQRIRRNSAALNGVQT